MSPKGSNREVEEPDDAVEPEEGKPTEERLISVPFVETSQGRCPFSTRACAGYRGSRIPSPSDESLWEHEWLWPEVVDIGVGDSEAVQCDVGV